MKILLIGISGHEKDFLLSLPILKTYITKFDDIKNHFDVDIFEYGPHIDANKIISDIYEYNPDIIWFSCYIWNIDSIKEIIRYTSDKILICGGPEISLSSIKRGTFDDFDIDYFVYGEGEIPLYLILRTLDNPSVPKLGVVYKYKNKYHYGDNNFVENLGGDSVYLSGNAPDYLLNSNNRFNIETQRGCRFKCAYCQYGKNFPYLRYRDPFLVIKEFEYLYSKGLRYGRVLDANFFSDKEHACIILKGLIDNKIKIHLVLEGNSVSLDDELVRLLGEYIALGNKVIVSVGLQSVNKDSCKAVDRYYSPDKYLSTMKKLASVNAIPRTDLIIGLPFETRTTYIDGVVFLVDVLRNSSGYIGLNILRILDDTKMVTLSKRYDLSVDENNLVYATPTMNKKDFSECIDISAIVFRIFDTITCDDDIKIRNYFYKLSDEIGYRECIYYLKEQVFGDGKYRFNMKQYPKGEYDYYKRIKEDIDNETLLGLLKK